MQDSHDDPDNQIPYNPHVDPTAVTDDGYEVYAYEPTDGIVPDIIIRKSEGDELVRLWSFVGHNSILVHDERTEHKHPPDFDEPDCQRWTLRSEDEWPPLADEAPTPEPVTELAMQWSDAPVADKTRGETDE